MLYLLILVFRINLLGAYCQQNLILTKENKVHTKISVVCVTIFLAYASNG